MKFSARLFFGVAQTVPALCANVISIPLTRKSNQDHDSLAKRSISQRVQNWGNMYTAEVQVGTPPQTMILDIDTGSTDTWVLGHFNQNDCVAEPYNCRGNDTFHAEKSNTYHEVTQDGFSIMYADSSQASGLFFEDKFTTGGVEVESVLMGLSLESHFIREGILGLSYGSDESSFPGKYESFLEKLVSGQHINSPVYSLWLNDLNDRNGAILFGGIDTEKFSGTLSSTPVQKQDDGHYSGFWVSLSSLGFSGKGLANLKMPVLLDSGTTFVHLPKGILDPIVASYDGWWDNTTGLYIANCSLLHSEEFLEFEFASESETPESNGPTIRVALSELIFDKDMVMGKSWTNASSSIENCVFALLPSQQKVLGDSFLRSAYVVHDLKNNKIGLAQACPNSTTSSIVEIQANATTIPTLLGRHDSSCSSIVIASDSGDRWMFYGGISIALLLLGLVIACGYYYIKTRCHWYKGVRPVEDEERNLIEESITLEDLQGDD